MTNPCGTCGMCCKLPTIDERRLKKARNTWCHFWKQGIGCTEYKKRPETCQTYDCIWLDSRRFPKAGEWPESWRPDKCKAIFSYLYDNIVEGEDGGLRGENCIGILVSTDPLHPHFWKEKDKGKLFEAVKGLCRANKWILQE